jgi:hypothetical protein
MAIVVGPILGFRGTSKQRWTVGALVVVEGDSPPPLSWPEGPSPTPVRLAAHKGRTAWRFDLEAAQRDCDRTLR